MANQAWNIDRLQIITRIDLDIKLIALTKDLVNRGHAIGQEVSFGPRTLWRTPNG